jgi:type IV secretion system protein VirB5
MVANPYVEARREWDERYADLVLGKRNWQIAAGGLLAATLILAGGIVWQATRSRYIPYIVEVDKLGYALTVPQPLTASVTPDAEARIERYEIATFILNARSVSSDPAVEQQQLNSLLAHARGAADHFLDAYYHANGFTRNPFKIAEKQTVTVQIDSILQISKQSYQVRWSETARDLNGINLGVPTRWEAQLQTEIIPPNSADTIINNPLGLFVTQISWTQQAE